ncbi:hypothetical protein PPACK8108_LOCUS15299 [Phakopsora pachyrhizi]|uniref:Uncharacterized protein n=1 Tax=Phakopsora pachyrhizi TaxID=170000 RepID=A0AAV0B8C0_PHAPC|nr:hypothetical protein PPACK8108_LOCUS15299 [Phakopsora pachyrhizi]
MIVLPWLEAGPGRNKYKSNFTHLETGQVLVNRVWYSFWIIGNTGYPVVLRGFNWLIYKLTPSSPNRTIQIQKINRSNVTLHKEESYKRFLIRTLRKIFRRGKGDEKDEDVKIRRRRRSIDELEMIRKNLTEVGRKDVLMFLLDHPRRCFVYLFPNIGNPAVKAISIGTRVLCRLLQSLSVRAAGFSVVLLAAVAPALQVKYIVMIALKDNNPKYNRDDVGEEDERANVTLERSQDTMGTYLFGRPSIGLNALVIIQYFAQYLRVP